MSIFFPPLTFLCVVSGGVVIVACRGDSGGGGGGPDTPYETGAEGGGVVIEVWHRKTRIQGEKYGSSQSFGD